MRNENEPSETPGTENLSESLDRVTPPTKPQTKSDLLSNEKPRLWTVWAVFLASFAALTLFQLVVVIGFMIPEIVELVKNQGQDESGINEFLQQLSTPLGFIMIALPGQLGLLFVVCIAARLSPVPWAERLGFRDSGLSWLEWSATGVATVVPAAIGIGLASALTFVIAADDSVEKMYNQMTYGIAIPFILFIALVPGFAEEMLYRGYLQRRLLKRWGPVFAILTTSTLFAISHVTPHAVVFTFPVGIWLGYVAWKTNSIWPTVLGHAFINGIWNVLNISKVLFDYSDTLYYSFCGVLVLIGLIGLLVAWPALQRSGNRISPA